MVKLELEVEFRGFGTAAAAQRLLQAEAPAQKGQKAPTFRRSGQARNVLRWFSTAVLYAAFLGLVRADAAPLPGWGTNLLQATCPSQLDSHLRSLHVL